MEYRLADLLDTYPDTTIAFGDDCLLDFENLMFERKPATIVAFTGRKSVEKNRAWKIFLRALNNIDVKVVRFSEIEPEPCIETVEKMIAVLKREAPDEVVAIGGGSVLDAAKAAFLVHQSGGDLRDYFGVNRYSGREPDGRLKKVICFPTTSGTGSEATPYSNIVDHENGVKKLIVEREIIPEYSFVYPAFAMSMPEAVTLATACDALAHSLEGLLNVGQDGNHLLADQWALKSIALVVEYLPRVLQNENDLEARTALAAAAALGGMVIRYKSTGLPHLCSFSWFGRIEHGIAVALLLPAAWKFYLGNDAVRERTMELSDIFKPTEQTAESVIAAYRSFLDACGVPSALREFPDITPELLEQTAAGAGQNKMKLELAPRPVPLEKSVEVLSGILRDAYNG